MKTTHALLWLLPLATALLVACGDNNSSTATGTAARANSCLADYIDRPCELLTVDRLRAVYPDLSDNLETDETLATQSCQHRWPSERSQMISIGSLEVETPVNNLVAISWLKTGDPAVIAQQFNRAYRTLNAEEQAATLAALDRQLEQQSDTLTEQQRALASDIGHKMIGATRYQPVDKLGTAAAWDAGKLSNTLKVLDRDTEFGIEINVSDDSDENRTAAIAIATALLATCP